MDVEERAQRLLDHLRAAGPVAVAFSGGADSALVLAAAARASGPDAVLAVTAVSASLPARELSAAQGFAADLGVRHLLPRTTEMAVPGYTANGRDRCYFCKSTVLDAIAGAAEAHGVALVASGVNADDAVDPFRPGIRAGDERHVLTPLRDTGMTKDDVRAVSGLWGLSTSAKPAAACLASRVRYGIRITPGRLARVERAEVAVRSGLAGIGIASGQLRVRDLGGPARVELDPHLVDLPHVAAVATRAVRDAGFDGAVELAAFRSGSLNALP